MMVQARAALKLEIENTLDSGLPRVYALELFRQKCSAVFEHVYESTRSGIRGLMQTSPDHPKLVSHLAIHRNSPRCAVRH